MSDAELVRRAREGDRDAFGALVERYKGLVVMHAFRKVGRASDAEDIAQDAFVRAFLSLRRLREEKKFRSWVLAIAANLARDWHRRKKPTVGLELAGADGRDPAAEENELRMAVIEAIESLPETYQLVAAMRYLEGLRYSEMSVRLGLSEVALRKRIHRANQLLREKLRGFS